MFPVYRINFVFLFNNLFVEDVFPDVLKITKVKPLLKKCSKTSLNNYKLIPLSIGLSKILEKLMKALLTITTLNPNFSLSNKLTALSKLSN